MREQMAEEQAVAVARLQEQERALEAQRQAEMERVHEGMQVGGSESEGWLVGWLIGWLRLSVPARMCACVRVCVFACVRVCVFACLRVCALAWLLALRCFFARTTPH